MCHKFPCRTDRCTDHRYHGTPIRASPPIGDGYEEKRLRSSGHYDRTVNRRRVLGLAGVSITAGFAGCLEGIQEHFGLQGIIPIEIHSEADRTHNLHLEARESETGRQSYEQSYSVTPGETVGPPHLEETDQSFRVARIENEAEADVSVVSVTPETELVTIYIYDDELVVDVHRSEDGANGTVDGDGTNETVDGDDG